MADRETITYRELIKEVRALESKADRTYAKLIEFEPIKKAVYTVITMIVVAVVGAIIKLVVI